MIVIAKIVTNKDISFTTFENEEKASDFVSDNSGLEDIELFVDVSVVKHYKDRYFEAYKTLFASFSPDTKISINDKDDTFITSVKYENISEGVDRLKTFSSYKNATDFIDDELADLDDFGAIQVLVNISQVLDYKEKYNEFYKLLLENSNNNSF